MSFGIAQYLNVYIKAGGIDVRSRPGGGLQKRAGGTIFDRRRREKNELVDDTEGAVRHQSEARANFANSIIDRRRMGLREYRSLYQRIQQSVY